MLRLLPTVYVVMPPDSIFTTVRKVESSILGHTSSFKNVTFKVESTLLWPVGRNSQNIFNGSAFCTFQAVSCQTLSLVSTSLCLKNCAQSKPLYAFTIWNLWINISKLDHHALTGKPWPCFTSLLIVYCNTLLVALKLLLQTFFLFCLLDCSHFVSITNFCFMFACRFSTF